MVSQCVSIIIPNYNNAIYLPECLDSCIEQGEFVKEIIIIDDHSTDKSWEIIKQYETKYPSLIKSYKNLGKGACRARNYGYKLSSGDYIQWIDSDDFIGEDKLMLQLNDLTLLSPSGISFSKTTHLYQYLDGSERRIIESGICYRSSDKPAEFLLTLWGGSDLIGGTIQTSAWLIPRKIAECAGPWNESLLRDQDGEFFTRVVLCSDTIIYSSLANTFYRKAEKSVSITKSRSEAHLRSELDALNLKHSYLIKYKEKDIFKKAFSKQYFTLAVNFYPQYKSLSSEAWQQYRKYNYPVPVPKLGGMIIEIFKELLGWRKALWIKHLITNK